MRVAIDCRFAALPAGIGRFTREVVLELVKRRDPWSYALILPPEAEAWAASLPVQVPSVMVSSRHYSPAEQWTIPRALRTLQADLLFAPQFNVPFFFRKPYIVTIHDLILHHYPNQASFLKRALYRILFSRSVCRAKSIITISHRTEKDLIELMGRRVQKKIHVVPLGVSSEFHPVTQEEQDRLRSTYQIHRPFLLYIGGAKEHKNVQMLINAFSAGESPTHDLLLLISGAEADRLTLAPHVTLLRNVPDCELPVFLSAASAYVTATKEEGFGLPLLEAMACGCPVLASSIPVFRELFQEHVRLVAEDHESLTEGMKTIIENPPSSEERDKALQFARSFTWQKTAEKIAEEIARVSGIR
jgi:glycosyltransferase involved in cell wall biosynthesis